MALAQVHGVVLWGVTGAMVTVEAEVSDGLPSVGVIGLPDTSVGESRWRARSAIESTGARWPNRRVTISLTPAEIPKHGAGLDLPIAIGVLAANAQLDGVDLGGTAFIGELGLDGRLRATRGALAGALAARAGGLARVIVAADGAADIARLPGIAVFAAVDLAQVLAILRGADPGVPLSGAVSGPEQSQPDLADVRGHAHARFALTVAAAGGHHMAMVGPPGVGKTLLAERLPGILPDLDDDAAIEVAAIHSAAGLTRDDFHRPPYRAPHHSASGAALLGAAHGHRVRPGAVTLAHRGVLFMDEAPEFARPSLEGLRQPLESGQVALHRAGWSGMLPAAFQLVLAANPCPCGQRSGTGVGCSCPPQAVRRYAARLSGPLLDRIDIRLRMTQPAAAELQSTEVPDTSRQARARVTAARDRARSRYARLPWSTNAAAPAAQLRRDWPTDDAGARLLADMERGSVNLRGIDRVLRMAWTLADLAERARPGRDEVAMALSLRGASLSWSA